VKRTAALLVLLCAADWALTADGLALGFNSELNPLVAPLFEVGAVFAFAWKIGLTAVGAGLLALARAPRALAFCVWVYAALLAYQVGARLLIL